MIYIKYDISRKLSLLQRLQQFELCLLWVFSWLTNYFSFFIIDKGITNIVQIDLYYKLSDSEHYIHDSETICNKIIHSLILPFNLPQRILFWWSIALWLNKKQTTVLFNSWLDANNSILKEVVFQYTKKFIFCVANDVFEICEKFLTDTNVIFYC